MEKRKRQNWMAMVVVGVVAFMVILAVFPDLTQSPGPIPYAQQSAQPGVSANEKHEAGMSQISGDTTSLLFYPNPVRHTLHVVVPRKAGSYVWLGIYQANGQLVKKYAIETGRVIEINVQALEEGNYVIKVGDRQGHSWSGKFLKTY